MCQYNTFFLKFVCLSVYAYDVITWDCNSCGRFSAPGYLGSISAVSRVRSLILPEVRVHFPLPRLVIEPTGYMYVVKVHVAAF